MINSIIELAKGAGELILEYYSEEIEVTTKGDDSPLTKADLAAHHFIVDGLRKITPEIPIISEESGVPEYDIRKEWEKFWMVDPLDGTKEFIKKNGEFTVNIALIEGNKPVLGVVYVPAMNITYYGDGTNGSFKLNPNGDLLKLETPEFKAPGVASIVVSRSHGDDDTKKKLKSVGIEVADEVPSGSSIKFCLVAEGKADIYPRLGPTMEWDTAAADAVYRYSGSSGEKYSPLTYNKKNLLNPYFILGVSEFIDAQLLKK
jgi:3'(2'), 5'-bisphosphate nucleotidase